jgi:stromal membrane-associated protein
LDGGWGSNSKSTKPKETTITADEDFGGWNSAPTIQNSSTTTTTTTATKPGGASFGGANDDLFDNVWG